MTCNPRTFLLEPIKNLDVTDAEIYGQLHILFPSHGMRSSMWEPSYVHDLHHRLEEHSYDPTSDYLVVAGNQGLVNISLAEMVARYGQVKCLLWNASTRTYVPMTLGGMTREQSTATAVQRHA